MRAERFKGTLTTKHIIHVSPCADGHGRVSQLVVPRLYLSCENNPTPQHITMLARDNIRTFWPHHNQSWVLISGESLNSFREFDFFYGVGVVSRTL